MSDYQQRIAGSFQEGGAAEPAAEAKGKPPLLERVSHHSALADCVLVIMLFFAAQVIAFVVNTKCSHPTARSSRRS